MNYIHDTSIVDPGAKIGAHTSIWHFCHVEGRAIIGENCNLGQNVYVGNDSVVGNACRLGNCVSIFEGVVLEDFVFCAPFMVFTHISFPRAAVNRRSAFQQTVVKTGATLGANSTVVPGVTVGAGTFLAAGATLTRDSKDWSLMVGLPAKHTGWVSAFGEKIPLPLEGLGEWRCGFTGDVYVLSGSVLERHPGPLDILRYMCGVKLTRPVGRDF